MSDIPTKARHRLAVYAIGGNALSDPALVGGEASAAAAAAMDAVLCDVVDLLEAGTRVVITHGNGPQVGEMLLMEEALSARRRDDAESPPPPEGLDHWVAATQGTLGHEIATRLDSALRERGRHEQVATLLTRVEVDPDDPAFASPTKPIGPIIDDLDAVPNDWKIGETAAGPRRVVASPAPLSIVDDDAISALLGAGAVVLCAGGGGIPVVKHGDGHRGVDAVIDKDRVSALLATSLAADMLVISTAIAALRLAFGKESERTLREISRSEAEQHMESGQFPSGSMGPKVSAMLSAKSANPEMQVVLCQPGEAFAALRGEAGTEIT